MVFMNPFLVRPAVYAAVLAQPVLRLPQPVLSAEWTHFCLFYSPNKASHHNVLTFVPVVTQMCQEDAKNVMILAPLVLEQSTTV